MGSLNMTIHRTNIILEGRGVTLISWNSMDVPARAKGASNSIVLVELNELCNLFNLCIKWGAGEQSLAVVAVFLVATATFNVTISAVELPLISSSPSDILILSS